MKIPLLKHHVSPVGLWREYGVFDGWAARGLEPTISDVHKKVIPELKKRVDSNGNPIYAFLTKDPKAGGGLSVIGLRCIECFYPVSMT